MTYLKLYKLMLLTLGMSYAIAIVGQLELNIRPTMPTMPDVGGRGGGAILGTLVSK